ncbi:hypothetical protein DEI91_12205 [Curtobacterium sp. MCBD17_032]|nr:hypothetical protein DEI91_12205 [Curtobacterium sp. MCBD17_032]
MIIDGQVVHSGDHVEAFGVLSAVGDAWFLGLSVDAASARPDGSVPMSVRLRPKVGQTLADQTAVRIAGRWRDGTVVDAVLAPLPASEAPPARATASAEPPSGPQADLTPVLLDLVQGGVVVSWWVDSGSGVLWVTGSAERQVRLRLAAVFSGVIRFTPSRWSSPAVSSARRAILALPDELLLSFEEEHTSDHQLRLTVMVSVVTPEVAAVLRDVDPALVEVRPLIRRVDVGGSDLPH